MKKELSDGSTTKGELDFSFLLEDHHLHAFYHLLKKQDSAELSQTDVLIKIKATPEIISEIGTRMEKLSSEASQVILTTALSLTKKPKM